MQEYVYLMTADQYGKVGISTNPESRLRVILASNHPQLSSDPVIAHVIPVTMARRCEAAVHRHLEDRRTDGEWFVLDASDIAWFRSQTDASLTELANQYELKTTYRGLSQPPRDDGPRKPRIKVNISLSEDMLEYIREIAKLDMRSVPNQIEWILMQKASVYYEELKQAKLAYLDE